MLAIRPSALAFFTSTLVACVISAVACSSSSSGGATFPDGGTGSDTGGGGGNKDGGGGGTGIPDSNAGGAYDVGVTGPFDATYLDDVKGANSTCAGFTAYDKCNDTDPCAQYYFKDCTILDGIYSATGRTTVNNCYGSALACSADSGVSETNGCMFAAAGNVTPDTVQNQLASDFCMACSGDAGTSTCQSAFYSIVQNDAGETGPGALMNLTLISDSYISMIDSMCISSLSGPDCGDEFTQCALTIIQPYAQACTGGGGTGDASFDGADPGGA